MIPAAGWGAQPAPAPAARALGQPASQQLPPPPSLMTSSPIAFPPTTGGYVRCRAMGGRHYSCEVRQAAVDAWYEAGRPPLDNLAPAVTIFRQTQAPEALPSNPSEFVHTWVSAWRTRFTLRSRSPEPRKPGITDDEAREVVRILTAGYQQGQRHRCYHSIKQAAERDGRIKESLQKKSDSEGKAFTLCTLWRRLKQVEPTLTRKTLRYTFKLTAAHRNARVAYCTRLMAMPEQERKRFLARVVWIDSKTLYVVPRAMKVYAANAAQLLVQDPRVPASMKQAKKIHYYAAVNAALGAVYWCTGTGTTPEKAQDGSWWYPTYKHYKVSACRAASKAYELVHATKLQWGFCCTCATAHCTSRPHCLSSLWWKRSRRSLLCQHCRSSCLSCCHCTDACLPL